MFALITNYFKYVIMLTHTILIPNDNVRKLNKIKYEPCFYLLVYLLKF